jgi:hypothetical protein
MVRSSGSSKIRKASMISFKVAAPGAPLSPRSIRERLPASRLHRLASLVSVIPRRFLKSCRRLPNASLPLRAGPSPWEEFCTPPTSEVSPELITTNFATFDKFCQGSQTLGWLWARYCPRSSQTPPRGAGGLMSWARLKGGQVVGASRRTRRALLVGSRSPGSSIRSILRADAARKLWVLPHPWATPCS